MTTQTPQPLMEARSLTKTYEVSKGLFQGKGHVQALRDVSFSLFSGQTLAVVGESGCGKSTLARQVTMIETPSSGSLILDGKDVAGADEDTLKIARRRVQIVFQNPYGSLNPRKRVLDILSEPLVINTDLSKTDRTDKVREMMAKVGLRPEFSERYPHMFSGGQRQRIAIARALMLEPTVIVADEPVSALDVSVQAQVLNLMMDLQEETGVAFLFISHDLSVVEHISNDVMVMYLGRVVEQGPKEKIFASPRHPYTRALLSATPRLSEAERKAKVVLQGELPSPLNPPSGCSFHTRCPFATAACKSEVPSLRDFDGRKAACIRLEEISD